MPNENFKKTFYLPNNELEIQALKSFQNIFNSLSIIKSFEIQKDPCPYSDSVGITIDVLNENIVFTPISIYNLNIEDINYQDLWHDELLNQELFNQKIKIQDLKKELIHLGNIFDHTSNGLLINILTKKIKISNTTIENEISQRKKRIEIQKGIQIHE